MQKWLVSLTLGGVIMGCTSISEDQIEIRHTDTTTQSNEKASVIPDNSNWLDYADAKADANIALEKGDTRLLAFANRALNLPGIEPSLHKKLMDSCGYRVLSGTGDMLIMGEKPEHRSMLRAYAKIYNQQVAAACQAKES